ncbi:glycoside hydrolase family 31 protein [Streptomyces lycii]|uniref:Glycoside hydrolase family 31 protein n=1 Tax=Streptomyces lycii TaxID=2654337 RepID=A0ABQ7FIS6_9ACTN|nr:glycoside hydrolase family 31 protein [Streptomyces lycii]KAF4407153.1 glycoside hydrolase family 31 protein [Streptomyces lycii]
MDARDLVRSVKVIGTTQGLRSVRAAWRLRRADAWGLPPRGAERARVPGAARDAEPGPGGGVVRFARSSLLLRVTSAGAVFCGWDGAAAEPSYALARGCPEADARAELEPDRDGGWRVVSARVTVAVSRHGAVEFRTPGGVLLRRDLPPRWWDRAGTEPGAGGPRWVQRSEVAADARFFGPGPRVPGGVPGASGAGPGDGTYRLWNGAGDGTAREGDGLPVTMPVQLVVADAGSHLVFHDNTWDGRVRLRAGAEGLGSGHDRRGSCELEFEGGPARSWVVVGSPARVLRGFRALTGAPALPPAWALGHQHVLPGECGADEVRAAVDAHREHGLPLSALHVPVPHQPVRHPRSGRRRASGGDAAPADLPRRAAELRRAGVRLVSAVPAGIREEPGEPRYESGMATGAFVTDGRGRPVRGVLGTGASVFPDFTDPQVRKWWSGLYAERLALGFAGFWHGPGEPGHARGFGEPALPRSARHVLEGRGGDHREAHNVYGLAMARAAHDALRELRPDRRPFVLSGSGWAGVQRYGGVCPGGAGSGWDGLRDALSVTLGLGLCGVPYSGPDIGAGPARGDGAGPLSPELWLRGLQLAAYLPLFRTVAATDPRPGPAGRCAPWGSGTEVLEHARAVLRERERLLPYFTTLARAAHRTGAPYARPLWWDTPEDRALRACDDAFLLGDALLVAPVLERGAVRRDVRLPPGRWYDTATGAAYEGPGRVLLDAPLSRVPVLARAGAVLPVAAPGGGVELEVWAPAPGRRGGGEFAADPGDGWDLPPVQRWTSVRYGGRVVVEGADGAAPGLPLRVRGLPGGGTGQEPG